MECFGLGDKEEMSERFFSLWQEGIVHEYCRDFEQATSTMDEIPECLLEGQFINGLRPDIQAKLKAHRPRGLGRIMLMAQKLEKKKIQTLKQYKYPNSRGNKFMNISVGGASKTLWIDNHRTTTSKVSFRKLLDPKLQAKIEKGLCYHCDEKFSPRHRR